MSTIWIILSAMIPLVLILGIFTAIFNFRERQTAKTNATWGDWARAHDLSFNPTGGLPHESQLASVEREITGDIHGGHIRVSNIHTPVGFQKYTTEVQITFDPPLGARVRIGKRTLLSGRVTKTGDADFDAAVAIEMGDPAKAVRLMTPQVRAALTALSREASFDIDGKTLTWNTPDPYQNPKKLALALDAALQATEALQQASSALMTDPLSEGQGHHTLPDADAPFEVAATHKLKHRG